MDKINIYKRIAIYQIALTILKNDIERFPFSCMGLCNCISVAAYKSGYTSMLTSAYDDMPNYYPEVYAQKPDSAITNRNYWFERNAEGGQIRVKILEKAIVDCNLLLEQSV